METEEIENRPNEENMKLGRELEVEYKKAVLILVKEYEKKIARRRKHKWDFSYNPFVLLIGSLRVFVILVWFEIRLKADEELGRLGGWGQGVMVAGTLFPPSPPPLHSLSFSHALIKS